ncbi:MAG: hypothetical protein RH917_01920 [Lacipirellulaceae bacterium]
MQPLSSQTLADLVSKRLTCLQQLHAIGLKQSQLIVADQMSELLRLISTKQKLITAIQAIEQALQPFHGQDPEARVWASPAARQHCAAEAESCRKLLAEVMTLEQSNERLMTARRDETATKLNSTASANKVRGAYQAQQTRQANKYRTDQKTNIAAVPATTPTVPTTQKRSRS